MSEQHAMDWADELALEVIALVHRYRIETARQLIASHLRAVRNADGSLKVVEAR